MYIWRVKKLLIVLMGLLALHATGQDSTAEFTTMGSSTATFRRHEALTAAEVTNGRGTLHGFNKKKLLVDGMGVGIYGGMLAGLSQAWYNDYPRSSFHSFNDVGEWQQMDKVGHAWAVYSMSHIGYGLWRWSGYSNKQATLLASGSGLAFMLGIEYLDGRSAEWGWSWGDAGADLFGAALFAGQQLTWNEQKIRLKFSSHVYQYPVELQGRARTLFGSTLPNKLLKDYNAQTYWLSFPLPQAWHLPRWLRLSVGYGADGMYGGFDNTSVDKNGLVTFDRRDIKRYRQWYLAPDIDLTQIKTRSKLLRSVFYSINILKFPAPALELSNGKLKGRFLAF
ncbi:MAG: DUF2279 domain-containing protein [Chitinophagaceae bacterium]|nr:MAG: DUF2279 domain-containing protein [Chitinophagaceae bacterium]